MSKPTQTPLGLTALSCSQNPFYLHKITNYVSVAAAMEARVPQLQQHDQNLQALPMNDQGFHVLQGIAHEVPDLKANMVAGSCDEFLAKFASRVVEMYNFNTESGLINLQDMQGLLHEVSIGMPLRGDINQLLSDCGDLMSTRGKKVQFNLMVALAKSVQKKAGQDLQSFVEIVQKLTHTLATNAYDETMFQDESFSRVVEGTIQSMLTTASQHIFTTSGVTEKLDAILNGASHTSAFCIASGWHGGQKT
eukprot:6469126-Amphidinium_carterae.1